MCLIGRKVEDIKIVFDALLSPSLENRLLARHPECLGIAFNNDIFYGEKSLKIGYTDEFCSGCMKRALLTSYGHLASLGYELVKLQPTLPYFDEIFETALSLYFNLNFLHNKSLISKNEEKNEEYQKLLDKLHGNFNIWSTLARIMFQYQSQRENIVKKSFFKSSDEVLKSISRLQTFKEQALRELTQLYNCDIFLCPVFPVVAPPLNCHLSHLLYGYSLTLYWNVLGMPSGTVP